MFSNTMFQSCMSFTDTIGGTNNLIFFFQFSFQDNVQDLRQVVLDRPESCYRTCFSLQIDGVRLDDFSELHMVEGLKDGATIRVVEGIAG